MSKYRTHNLPAMLVELTLSSWETIFHRSMMIAQGTCDLAEYERMVTEKASALQDSAVAIMSGEGHAAALEPFLVRTQANAKRLRRRS